MAIELNCPSCQTLMQVPDAAAGKKARCPKCQAICEIPASTGSMASLPFGEPQQPFAPLSAPPNEPKPNPFGDALPTSSATSPNPYASPNFAGAVSQMPLTPEALRAKLLGPAIGIVVGAVICLSYALLNIVVLALGAGPQIPDNDPMRALGMFIGATIIFLPSIGMLAGSVGLFRGKPKWLAWVSVIAAVLPCNPCCFINLGFGIWGIVMLCDPRVSSAME